MRMNSSIKIKRDVRGRKKVAVTLFILVVLLAASQFFNVNLLSSILHKVARPAWIAGNVFSDETTTFFKFLRSKRSLIEENKRLKTQLSYRETLQVVNDVLIEENRELQKLLGRDIDNAFIVGRILAKPNVTLYDTFIIDVGDSDGVKVGDRAIVDNYFVIGEVSEVFLSTSIVTLFSAPNKKTNVIIGPTNIFVVAEGLGGGNFRTKLPRGVDIKEGDNISLADIGINIFGRVEKIIVTPADQFQTILFKNPVNTSELRFISIVR